MEISKEDRKFYKAFELVKVLELGFGSVMDRF